MFLHIGNGETVRRREVIGIFDLDTASVSQETRRFLGQAEKDGIVTGCENGDLPRSFLLIGGNAGKKGKPTPFGVRLSIISTAGLRLRLQRKTQESDDESKQRG